MLKNSIFLFHGNFKILIIWSYISKWNTLWCFPWKRKCLLYSREFFLNCFEIELKSSFVLSCRAHTRAKRWATAVCLWHPYWKAKIWPPRDVFFLFCFLDECLYYCAGRERHLAKFGVCLLLVIFVWCFFVHFFCLSWWGFLLLIIVLNLVIVHFPIHLKKIREEPEVFTILQEWVALDTITESQYAGRKRRKVEKKVTK